MPNKKKGKKKAPSKTKASAVEAPPSSCTKSLDDVSHLLFDDFKDAQLPYELPFVGPISLVDRRHCEATEQQVVHGRGLIVTRDVSPGECLFVIPATISTPIDEVWKRFLEFNSNECSSNELAGTKFGIQLEDIAETLLVERIQSLRQNDDDGNSGRTLNSFLSQMSSDDVPQTELDVVLARTPNSVDQESKESLDNETILNIIRRNAFGPDYHSYDTIANWWLSNLTNHALESSYKRLLSVFPLAAMINHSCCPNAVRIFGTIPNSVNSPELKGREVMIVHACAAMKKGTEITWSYLPPTTDFKNRHELLKTKYGFSCQCVRCKSEEKVMDEIELFQQMSSATTRKDDTLPETIHSLELTITSKSIPSQVQRYLRISHAPIYMQYFNEALSTPSQRNNDESISSLLKLATQLHFSFVSCNNASTEHISILHLCYELASLQHTRYLSNVEHDGTNPTKTISQVRFWTDQLKLAHMIRYGKLGERLECVRDVMKRSRVVLRNRDGWYAVGGGFI